jgi:cytochrome oxidase Cu insertion factor (SCO1/SenC/PrrC family)
MQTRNRKRLQLILLASLFILPMGVAALLAFSGWVPDARSYGEGIVPQRVVDGIPVELADGTRLDWHDPEWRWSVVAIPGRNCADACKHQLDQVHRARVSLNQKANRVRLLYLGTPPIGTDAEALMRPWDIGKDLGSGFAEWKPDVDDGLALVLVKPDAIALTFYADGFNASGLRKDLAKVTK